MPDPPYPDDVMDVLRGRAKAELRKRMRKLRAAMPATSVARRSEAIIQGVRAHPSWGAAKTVALFASMPDEVQLQPLIVEARNAGLRVALPVVTDADVLTFRCPWDGGVDRALVTSAFGIDEPDDTAPELDPATVDVVLVPALAVDPSGHRLGYGRGYYDRTLPRLSRAVRIVVAFDFQMIAEVPVRATDVACDVVITDARTIDLQRR